MEGRRDKVKKGGRKRREIERKQREMNERICASG